MTGYFKMKATFSLLLMLFFGFSAISAEVPSGKTGEKTATEKDQSELSGEKTGKTGNAKCPAKTENKADLTAAVTVERISAPGDVKYKKGKRIPNLILTADYQSPAALAEIARRDSDVMYILLPTEYSAKQKIMVYPPKIEDAFELPEEKLSGFLAFVNPKRVILLGGTEVIPPKYRLAIGSKTERAEIEDLNWNINAIILGNLLMDREMQKKFREAIRNRAAEALHAPDTGK